MSNKSLISVVLPTYNRLGRTLDALESALAQKWRPLEILVIDDGSTDGSGDRLEDYLAHRREPGVEITLIRQTNQGPSLARNAGLALARGRYIAFLDSDDTWLPEKLNRQISVLEQFPECGVCFTDTRCLNDNGMDKSALLMFGHNYPDSAGVEHEALRLLARSFCGYFLSALLVSADLIRYVGGLDPAIPFAEDRDLCFRLAMVTSFAYLNESMVHSDRGPSPSGSDCRPWDKIEVRLTGHQRMYEKWIHLPVTLSPEIRRIVRRGLQATHSQWANWHLECGCYARARQEVSRAIRYSFSPKVTAKWALTWTAPAFAALLSGRSSSYLQV
jgi:glycosyltransferase involved in cell wall biosynthesis